MRDLLFIFLAPAMLAFLFPALAQQRGITIQYKERAAADAPIEGTINLYPKSYALVIGNDAYSGGWSRLSNGVKASVSPARSNDAHF